MLKMPAWINKINYILKAQGAGGFLLVIWRRLLTPRAHSFQSCEALLTGAVGIEIGGPSSIFSRKGLLPVYPIVNRLDNCNYSNNTVWNGVISEGVTYQYDDKHSPGYQYIAEQTDLSLIPSGTYDFILSSHTIEHTSNPLRALREWMRVLKETGVLVLIVPHKDGTFDHRRPVTRLEHLIDDFHNNAAEDDLTHLPEILKLHDLALDPAAGAYVAFEERSKNNIGNRCLHQHAFDTTLVIELLDYLGLQIHAIEPLRPCHIISIAQKLPAGISAKNDAYEGSVARYSHISPFASDRHVSG
jgi:SAM-dependent methyltransferase